MQTLLKVKTGDIFLVKFHPGYGSEFQKYRPAVIMSDKITHIDSRFALIAPLTTNTTVVDRKTEFKVGNNPALEKDSLLLCWYLWTIDANRLVQKLGTLSPKDTKKMLSIAKNIFT